LQAGGIGIPLRLREAEATVPSANAKDWATYATGGYPTSGLRCGCRNILFCHPLSLYFSLREKDRPEGSFDLSVRYGSSPGL